MLGKAIPKVRDIWLIAPKDPDSSIGTISLTYLAQTTEKAPKLMPQMKRPMHTIHKACPIIAIPTPMHRIKLRMKMSLSLPIGMNQEQESAPAAAPRIAILYATSPNKVA